MQRRQTSFQQGHEKHLTRRKAWRESETDASAGYIDIGFPERWLRTGQALVDMLLALPCLRSVIDWINNSKHTTGPPAAANAILAQRERQLVLIRPLSCTVSK